MKGNILKTAASSFAALLLCGVLVLTGCANEIDDGYERNGNRAASVELDKSTSVKLHVFGVPATIKKCNVWPWADITEGDGGADDKNYATADWPGDCAMEAGKNSGYDVWSYTLKVDKNYQLGVLFVASDKSAQTGNSYIPKDRLKNGADFFFVWNNKEFFESADACLKACAGINSAQITSEDGKTVAITVSLLDTIDTSKLTVTDKNGTALTVVSATTTEITLSGGSLDNIPYTVSYDEKEVKAQITSELVEKKYGKVAEAVPDLGLTLNGDGTATFKVWAPLATNVELLLYADAESAGISPADYENTGATTKDLGTPVEPAEKMTFDSTTGVWSATVNYGNKYKYYKYKITNNGTDYYVCDIYAKAANADSYAAQIVDINAGTEYGTKEKYKNPFNGEYTDAVIYEMHIRDWSMGFKSGSTGKFNDITEALGTDGSGEFAKHLKKLGVTHVQILPMFDYAQSVVNPAYNWGYNPYHYNVPEGRYTDYSSNTDGTAAVDQMREMIKKFHDNGIAVNMDVVYNHTSGTGESSLYDSTVPEYFYRMNETGGYSSGSGCGNEIATNHTMVKKYVIDSLKHWMLDYHINGFRFDLMGLHETDTMKEIYEELSAIDPNVMVYGEPWAGGNSPVDPSTRKPYIDDCASSLDVNGVACFNDDIRDAVKGSDAFSFWTGHIQGVFNDSWITTGLMGSKRSAGGFTERAGRSLNYIECHDNYTFYDKLVFSALSAAGEIQLGAGNNFSAKFRAPTENQLALIKKQEKLAAAYIILAQGVPFLNGGQEFMRSKNGNPDSYAADEKGGKKWSDADIIRCNTINLSLRDTNKDVYNTYCALIKLRHDNPDAFGANEEAKASTVARGVTYYTTGDFTVIFNATDNDFSTALMMTDPTLSFVNHSSGIQKGISGKRVTLNESDGTYSIAETSAAVGTVPAKSFVILKK